MPVTLNEKFIAYLALFSGLAISIVAEYYSILGLTAIFSAAVIPVVIMGIALGIGKITATVWLKQNWTIAPWSIRVYLLTAIAVLMVITSMGIFGFLSKAHSDQSLVSGDVLAKIAIYDEKIKTARENIEANRRQLKQMDETFDQVMGRSTDEKGADKANAIRRSQQRDRVALAKDIEVNQKLIASLNDEAAPIRAEVRKVEAEVGPIKYIAAFVYGDTDKTILEKAVTWVIIILIVVFDPLAVILLLSSQISFENFRNRERWNFERDLEDAADSFNDVFADELNNTDKTPEEIMGLKPDAWVADVGEKPTEEEKKAIEDEVKEPAPHHPDTHPYLRQGFVYPAGWMFGAPLVAKTEQVAEGDSPEKESDVVSTATVTTSTEISEEAVQQAIEGGTEVTRIPNSPYVVIDGVTYNKNSMPARLQSYVQNEEQKDSNLWSVATGNPIGPEDYFRTSKDKKDN